MKKVLIFGGNQFVGKAICERLLEEEYEVYVMNRGSRENPVGAIHLKGDRNVEEELMSLTKDHYFEAIIDVSAYTPKELKISLEILKGNYKKYMFISTAAVYNKIGDEPVKEDGDNGKNLGGNPVWGNYGKDKYQCEKLLEEISSKNNSIFTVFRPFYIYGEENPFERERYFFDRILDNQPIFIPSKKTMVQFGYIKDLANNIANGIKLDTYNNEIFNIAGREYVDFREFAEVVGEVIKEKYIEDNNKKLEIKIIEKDSEIYKVREWFPFSEINIWGNISNLESKGGTIDYSLKEGLKATFDYYIENKQLKKGYKVSELENKFREEL